MDRDDIIRMATTAGMPTADVEKLEIFAEFVADGEREACAEICDELHYPWRFGETSGPRECAAAIRARKGTAS